MDERGESKQGLYFMTGGFLYDRGFAKLSSCWLVVTNRLTLEHAAAHAQTHTYTHHATRTTPPALQLTSALHDQFYFLTSSRPCSAAASSSSSSSITSTVHAPGLA